MREVFGDSSRNGEWEAVRLLVDGDRIVEADAAGLERDLSGLSLLEAAAQTWQDKTAIDFYDRRLSFREIERLAARAAKGLQALGVGPGVHVGLHLPNTPHYVVCFFAVLMAGGRVVNFSPLAAPRELKYQIADSDVQVMVTLGLPTLYPQMAALKGTAK